MQNKTNLLRELEAPGDGACTRTRRLMAEGFKLLLLVSILLFLGRAFALQLGNVRWPELRFASPSLLLAAACMVCVAVLGALPYKLLLDSMHHGIPWRQAMAIAWIASLGKYIPGKGAGLGGVIYLFHRHGVRGSEAISVSIMLSGLAMLIGLLAAIPLTLWQPVRELMPMAGLIGSCLFMAGVVCLHPRVFGPVITLLCQKMGRLSVPILPQLRDYAASGGILLVGYSFFGLALWVVAASLGAVSLRWIPLFISAGATATVAGVLVFAAPGGLGVREGITWILLAQIIGSANATIASLVIRVLQIVTEVVLAGTGIIMLRVRKHK